MSKQVGLFGGTFDPVHNGHVALVHAGLELGLDEVWVIPARPVHREVSGHADAETRLAWVQEVFADQDQVKVLDREVIAGRPVATIETLRWFAETHPGLVPWLMLGTDAWNGLPDWLEYPAHARLCNVAVFARKGESAAQAHAGWSLCDGVKNMRAPGHWLLIQADLPEISATGLRRDALAGRPLAGKVADAVCDRIEVAYAGFEQSQRGNKE